jgi:4-amino-4-deoxy-L-arabinose transferase-like glycosyltransferase
MRHFRKNQVNQALVTLPLLLYMLLGCAWIRLPGVQMDELLFLNAALPAVPYLEYPGRIRIFHHDIPTMLMSYLGAVKGLVWRGIFTVFGANVLSVRIPAVILGGFALWLFYLWVGRWYAPGVAIAALALAATDPTYIYNSRLDFGPFVMAHVFMFAGLLLATKWLETRASAGASRKSDHYLAGAAFCFGLGIWDKATFEWFLAALGCTLLIVFPQRVFRELRSRVCLISAGFFFLGALPLVLYNASNRTTHTSTVVKLDTLDRNTLFAKYWALQWTLRGNFLYSWTGGDSMPVQPSPSNPVDRILQGVSRAAPAKGTLLSFVLAIACCFGAFARGSRKAIFFPLLFSILLWVQIVLIRGAGGVHHYDLAYPLPHLFIAAALGWSWQNSAMGKVAAAILVSVLLVSQIAWDARHLASFHRLGGLGLWTDAIYEVAKDLDSRKPALVVDMDWGFMTPLKLLSKTHFERREFWGGCDHDTWNECIQDLSGLVDRQNTLFLFHSEKFDVFPRIRKVFEETLRARQMHARMVRVFKDRLDEPVIVLMATEPGLALSQ